MNQEQILKKAIEKAIKNDWCGWVVSWKVIKQGNYPYIRLMGSERGHKDSNLYLEQLIFSHDFAKAFWGRTKKGGTIRNPIMWWQYHLQKMVLEENPLKYIEKFLCPKKKK